MTIKLIKEEITVIFVIAIPLSCKTYTKDTAHIKYEKQTIFRYLTPKDITSKSGVYIFKSFSGIKNEAKKNIVEQINEMKESVLDRQQKRPVEVANLTKQGTLIDAQVAKMLEDKLYVIAQKISMQEQVEHNKIIKAMDAMADMIGTLGAGGLKPSTKMFEILFTLNHLLTNVTAPTASADLTITKA